MEIRHEVAARLLDVIIERAGGRMPETVLEWRTVARRLGVEQIKIVSPTVLSSPMLRDGVLWLPRVRHRYCLMMRYLAHETAEAGLGGRAAVGLSHQRLDQRPASHRCPD
jgi:hypothetical protein